MQCQKQIILELIRDEGLRLKPYRCPAGKLTIGVGRNLEATGISRIEAAFLLRNDIERCETEIINLLGPEVWDSLSEPRQRVLINMCFNLGINGLALFKRMLQALKEGDYEKAADEMLDSQWARQVTARVYRLDQMMRAG